MAETGIELNKTEEREPRETDIWSAASIAMTSVGPIALSAVLMLTVALLREQLGVAAPQLQAFVAAFVAAALVAAFLAVPVLRCVSGCLLRNREEDAGSSIFGVLTVATVISGLVMTALCAGVSSASDNVPLSFLTGYYFLGVLATDLFCTLPYASMLGQYRPLIMNCLLGALSGAGTYLISSGWMHLSRMSSVCWALAAFCFIPLCGLVRQCIHTWGSPGSLTFGFMAYLTRSPKSAAAGFAFVLGIYAPSILYLLFAGPGGEIAAPGTLPNYNAALYLAVLVNVPSLTVFVVHIDRILYGRYTRAIPEWIRDADGLAHKEQRAMTRTVRRQFLFAIEMTAILVCVGCALLPLLGAGAQTLQLFVLLSLGVGAAFCLLYIVVARCCRADYTSAYLSTLVFLIVTAAGSLLAAWSGQLLGFPLLIGALSGCLLAFWLRRQRGEMQEPIA